MGRFAGQDELFKAAASNGVDFLSTHIQLPAETSAVSASSPHAPSSLSDSPLDKEDLNALEDEDGRSLLHVACAAGHLQAADFLLRAGADFLKADEGHWTPLLSAASAGHLGVVKALIEAAEKASHEEGLSISEAADQQASTEVVKELLEARTPSGGTALTTAAAKGHTAVVEALLDAGANIEATDNYGRTALSKAVVASKEATVEALMRRGASLRVQEKFTGDNLLHLAVNSEHADLCLLLMRNDPDLRFQKNREGVTPFEAGRGPFLKHLANLFEAEKGENAEDATAAGSKED
ncbi:ankyrin repeat-containing protein [Toxoplasma gondii MAS]|uniref:Ankyrin repeat-containing protein n=1 Tax=Toxoplasma gondii MAS TaxID=943118 RepID=A0A086QSZ9_TOXGO|nr:ankyrin repeat-containing protein [Toxoplasma gondii MAS]